MFWMLRQRESKKLGCKTWSWTSYYPSSPDANRGGQCSLISLSCVEGFTVLGKTGLEKSSPKNWKQSQQEQKDTKMTINAHTPHTSKCAYWCVYLWFISLRQTFLKKFSKILKKNLLFSLSEASKSQNLQNSGPLAHTRIHHTSRTRRLCPPPHQKNNQKKPL